jgi:hypothetical protein
MNSRRRMSALKSRDRTYHNFDAKNALCVPAKLIGQCRNGSIANSRHWLLLNHFVGAGKERWWDFEAKRLGCVQIDDQLKLGRLLHR